MEKIPVVIIETPGQNRSHPILKILDNALEFKVVRLKATMGYELQPPLEPQINQEIINYGRSLTQNERACSISHQTARKIISQTNRGGIILEDDARIRDVEKLFDSSKKFLLSHHPKKHVLSLVSYYPKISKLIRMKGSLALPIPSPFPLAVAYTLTTAAASELSKHSLNYVADWPPSKCRYFVLHEGVVDHGDEESISTIGESNIRQSHTSLTLRHILKFLPITKITHTIVLLIKKRSTEKLSMLIIKIIQQF